MVMASVRGIGRCGHNQLVRTRFAAGPFFHEAKSLVYAEAVLLIHDNQPQFCIFHTFLKKSMSADNDLCLARCQSCIGGITGGAFKRAG